MDQIIVFNLSNAVPAAFLESETDESDATKKRRVDLCPEEWGDSFGDEFYEYSLQNSFYFIAPRTDWKAQEASRAIPGQDQVTILTDAELEERMTNLRKRVGSRHGE